MIVCNWKFSKLLLIFILSFSDCTSWCDAARRGHQRGHIKSGCRYRSGHKPAGSPDSVKIQINKRTVKNFIGIGGRYGCLQQVASKAVPVQGQRRFDKLIDADHFPPNSVYRSALHPHIQNLGMNNMAAVSISHLDHRTFITTNYPSLQVGHLRNLFANGRYYDAIDHNIDWYNTNPSRIPGRPNPNGGFLHRICEGVLQALDVHEINELITPSDKHYLIQKYNLTRVCHLGYDSVREDARKILAEDTHFYKQQIAQQNSIFG